MQKINWKYASLGMLALIIVSYTFTITNTPEAQTRQEEIFVRKPGQIYLGDPDTDPAYACAQILVQKDHINASFASTALGMKLTRTETGEIRVAGDFRESGNYYHNTEDRKFFWCFVDLHSSCSGYCRYPDHI